MSIRDVGSYIGHNRVTTTSQGSASGIWSLAAVERRMRDAAWPIPFAPDDIADLQLWLDASAAETLFDATTGGSAVAADGGVARWEDKSGNGRHATQGTAGNRPSYGIASWANKPSVNFTAASSHFLEFTPFALTAQTVFFVLEPTSSNGGVILNNITSVSGQFNRFQFIPNVAGYTNYTVVVGAGVSGNPSGVGANNVFAQEKLLLTTSYNNSGQLVTGNYVIRKNLVARTVESSDVVLSSGGNARGRIGCRSPGFNVDSDEFLSARYAEVIVYSRVLTANEIGQVESYLSAKWGIS